MPQHLSLCLKFQYMQQSHCPNNRFPLRDYCHTGQRNYKLHQSRNTIK